MATPQADEPVPYQAYPILVVDDEPDIVRTFTLNYKQDFTILGETRPHEVLARIENEPIAVLVSDQRMPEMSGVELIGRALETRPGLIPIILTGYTDIEALIAAINLRRIFRYVPKPWDHRELGETLRQAIEVFHLTRVNASLLEENGRLVVDLERANERLRHENRFLRRQDAPRGFEAIVGRSPALARILELGRKVAASDATVLIEGPTGTGKELLARAIHATSPRRERLFVPVNVGTLTESLAASTLFGHRRGAFTGATTDHKGLFEVADGGTLLLDEIGETPPALQVHLLRVLEEGEIHPLGAQRPVRVDVRVIAATNRNLAEEVKAGRFREDLLHRLRVFPLRLPSLDERREDIPLLAEAILAPLARKARKTVRGFDPEALAALGRHTYPGNVRQLENLIERALILCQPDAPITTEDLFEDLPEEPVPAPGDGTTLQACVVRFEKEKIGEVLARSGGNKTHAARDLGLTYQGLLKKMQRYGMA